MICIVGAGIGGLACASLLREKNTKVKVLEKQPYIGGLIHCEVVDDFLYHKVGGHVFNSKMNDVLDWFWKKFNREEEFVKAKRNAKILLHGSYLDYPIENSLHQLDRCFAEDIIQELILNDSKNVAEVKNFHDFLLNTFGQTLCELYFFPYNKKIWECSLKNVSIDWLEGKLPTPNIKSILVDNIYREKESKMVHSTFYYPKVGGSQFIADRLSEGLDISLGCPVERIYVTKKGLIVNGEICSKVIYTGDIRKLHSIIDSDDVVLRTSLLQLSDLKSHGTTNILCECDSTDISWLYLPEQNLRAHRIIYTGNFSPFNNGNSSRISCVVEFSGRVSLELMIEDIKNLPGNLRPIAHNYQESSYVIHDNLTREKINSAIKELNSVGIYPLGRFAEWQYYNMDAVIKSAMELAINI